MKNTLRNLVLSFAGIATSFACVLTMMSANQTCLLIIHQPKLPETAKSMRKF